MTSKTTIELNFQSLNSILKFPKRVEGFYYIQLICMRKWKIQIPFKPFAVRWRFENFDVDEVAVFIGFYAINNNLAMNSRRWCRVECNLHCLGQLLYESISLYLFQSIHSFASQVLRSRLKFTLRNEISTIDPKPSLLFHCFQLFSAPAALLAMFENRLSPCLTNIFIVRSEANKTQWFYIIFNVFVLLFYSLKC